MKMAAALTILLCYFGNVLSPYYISMVQGLDIRHLSIGLKLQRVLVLYQ